MNNSGTENGNLRLLMIGPLPPPVGGARVLFQHIVAELERRPEIRVSVIPTWPPGRGKLRKLVPAMKVALHTLQQARDSSLIAFFASDGGSVLFGSFVHIVARTFGMPWVLRVFGGSLDLTYAELPRWAKTWFCISSLSADAVLLETKHLVDQFESISRKRNILWHSNFRPVSVNETGNAGKMCRRFVFVGHVRPSKGLYEIIRASEILEQDVEIDIFGPLHDGMQQADFADCDKVTYRGVLSSEEVAPTLQKYDALLLPTYYRGEGYPGVVLEAYSVGVPVIASRWRALGEIVDETSGILVAPGDPLDLASAMRRLMEDDELYQELSCGAWERRRDFSIKVWTDRFIEYCHAAISGEAPRHAD